MTVAKTNASIHQGILLFRQWSSSDISTFLDKREVRGLPERVRDTIVLIECSKSLVVWLHGSLACQRLLPQMCVHYTQGTTHLAF